MKTRNAAHPVFFIITAVSFLFAFILGIPGEINMAREGIGTGSSVVRIVSTLMLLMLSLSLLRKRMTVFTAVLLTIMTFINICWGIFDICWCGQNAMEYIAESFFGVMAQIMLTVMAICSCKNEESSFLRLWFLPLVFIALQFTCSFVLNFGNFFFLPDSIRYAIVYGDKTEAFYGIMQFLNLTLGSIAQFIGMFFLGFSMKENEPEEEEIPDILPYLI